MNAKDLGRDLGSELLAKLQAEGRAPRAGEVVAMYCGRSTDRVTVEAVRVVAHNRRVVVYIEAGGFTFATPSITGWCAWHGMGSSAARLAPEVDSVRAALAELEAEAT